MSDPPVLATLELLNARAVPAWFDEAKFGIFIHWGLFAIPAFAPRHGTIGQVFRDHYDQAVALTPYTEWYWNAIRTPGTPSAEFHHTHYGDAPYEDFKQPFLDGLADWDPAAWATAFAASGARYVVLVTKHHDGFCLWPSTVANPHQADWTSPRDITGELAAAVRAAGLRFGVYYSGGIDWTFNREPLLTLGDFMGSTPSGAYNDYADAQVRELIARYEPSVLWNDICWPTDAPRLYRLFADYYNAVPEGVVNDRWVTDGPDRQALRDPEARKATDAALKAALARRGDEERGIIPQSIPHSDFRTPEYAAFKTTQDKKWEATRGMSHSFGFNRNDGEADYEFRETLLTGFIEAVSRNGNLLLNVGPRADGTIPREQLDRLKAFGDWLGANGEAIYGARPWTRSDGETRDGLPVRFTTKGGRLYLIVLGRVTGEQLVVKDLAPMGAARLLADDSPVDVEAIGHDLQLTFRQPPTGAFAPVVALGD